MGPEGPKPHREGLRRAARLLRIPLRFELRAGRLAEPRAADAGSRRPADGPSRGQRPGEDQRHRGGLLPGGAAFVSDIARRGSDRRARGRDGHGAPAGGDPSPGARAPVRDRAAADRAGGAGSTARWSGARRPRWARSASFCSCPRTCCCRARRPPAGGGSSTSRSSTSSAATTTRRARSRRCSRAGTRCSSAGPPTRAARHLRRGAGAHGRARGDAAARRWSRR